MLETGLVRSKNSINVAVKNLLDFAISMLAFAIFGFSLMFGDSHGGLFGSIVDFTSSNDLGAFFLYQMVFCGTAATIVSGAIAERSKLSAYLLIVAVLSAVTYPLIGHWCWGGALENTASGWLAGWGFVDWAGATVVHVTGGFAALAAVIAIGPRRNYKKGKLTGGHSLTIAIMGCFLLWFGWWGFNGGSGLNADQNVAHVLLNTNLGAVAGLLAAACWSLIQTGKTDVVDLITGTLAGLVAITGACHVISPWASLIAGVVGSIIALYTVEVLKKRNIDDAVGAIGVHGAAGAWGTVVFAIFAPTDMLACESRLAQLSTQTIGTAAAAGFSFVTIYAALRAMGMFTRLRVRAGEEKQGLNVVEHGATNEVTDLLGAMHGHRFHADYSQQLEIDTDTEVGQIASEYNRVIAKVHEEVEGHRATNHTLNDEKLRLQSVMEHVGVGIYQLDHDGRFLSANPTLLNIFGYSSASSLIDNQENFIIPWHNGNAEITEHFTTRFKRGEAIKDLETEFVVDNGENRWLLESVVPIRDARGRLISWLGTVHDVTERNRAMLAEVQIAEAKSKAKGEFLANMSHEIRTPLNGVIGMLDLLGTSDIGGKEENFVHVARSSADTLLSLINDILDFSKIEAGKLELEEVDFDLRELLESTAEQFAIQAHSKGLEINCRLDQNLPYMVIGDPERIRQSITNLMGNAIKFTEAGEINLNVMRRGSVIHFSVQDTGIGITEEACATLFESFVQADVSTTRKYGGTGLGLTIVSQLVQLMGGTLKVDSEVGQGSNFWFELAIPVAAEAVESQHQNAAVLEGLSKCHVLIVDDNVTNCEILEQQLAGWGMSAGVCRQSTSVVQKMLAAQRLGRPYDLVILDFCMPVKNGKDVAIEIKNHPALHQVPIIMLSSNHDLMTKDELAEAKIEVAMTKPARQSRLFDSIVSVLYKKRISRNAILDSVDSTIAASKTNQPVLADPATRTVDEMIAASEPVRSGQPKPSKTFVNASDNQPNDNQRSETVGRPLKADVLIAEDNFVNQIVVQQMLDSLGHSTDVAANGKDALMRVQQAEYKLVLMDGHMPIMDGLAASKAIRAWEQEQQAAGQAVEPVVIVALTANAIAGYKQDCIDAGMNDYLTKPITLQRLKEIALKYLGESKLRGAIDRQRSRTPQSQGAISRQQSAGQAPSASNPKKNETLVSSLDSQAKAINRGLPIEANENHSGQPAIDSKPAIGSDLPVGDLELTYLDLPSLDSRCIGNQEIQRQILSIMHNTMPDRLIEIRRAIDSQDLPSIGLVAHKLKGAAGDASLLAVRESASCLEQYANQNQADLIPGTLVELEERIAATICEIEKLLQQREPATERNQ